MNNKLIALAVAAAMAAPLAAQAEVSVSGQLQAEVMSMSGNGVTEGLYIEDARERGAQNSGGAGALKFSASEDLGGGLKAMAMYNMNIRATDATGPGMRDAYVGLSGGFGTVLFGRLSTPYKSSTVGWDPMLATGFQARGQYGMTTLHNGYADQVLAYANKFGNVKFVAALALDESDNDVATSSTVTTNTLGTCTDANADGTITGDECSVTSSTATTTGTTGDGETDADHAMTFSINAPLGPVELAVAYIDAGNDKEDATATKFGLKYSAGAVTVAAQMENIDKDLAGKGATDGYTQTYLTASYKMGANTLNVAMGSNDEDSNEVKDGTYTMFSVKHAFSKTTSGYVGYSISDSDIPNAAVKALGAGMRVKF